MSLESAKHREVLRVYLPNNFPLWNWIQDSSECPLNSQVSVGFIFYKLAWTIFKLPRTLPHPCRRPRGPFQLMRTNSRAHTCASTHAHTRRARARTQTSAAHVFHCLPPQTFRGAWFARFSSASIGAERKVILRKVVFRRSLCRLGLHWATHATWALACKDGATLPRSFRASLPRNTPSVLVFLACCWQLLF